MKKKKLFSVALILGMAFVVFPIALRNNSLAANLAGYFWGGSEDVNMINATGVVDGNETGVGWISVRGTNYGITFPDTDNGPVTGYAWSENVGWIDFNPQDHCVQDNSAGDSDARAGYCTAPAGKYCSNSCLVPAGTNCTAGVNLTTNFLNGCARIVGIAQETVSGNSGGWYGWLKFDNILIDGSGHFPNVNKRHAWNGENNNDPIVAPNNSANGLGWIDLRQAYLERITATLTASPSFGGVPLRPAFTATIIESSNSSANIIYQLDCQNDGTVDSAYNSNSGEMSHVFAAGICTYNAAGNYTAKVTITRGQATASPTATITANNVCTYNACNKETGYRCVQRTSFGSCPASNCSDTATPEKCEPKKFQEVTP